METIKAIIQKIITIPKEFYETRNKSEYTLLLESGYFETFKLIKEEAILDALKNDPGEIAWWLKLSADSRSSSRWNFGKKSNSDWMVSHWPPAEEYIEITDKDEFKTCAYFILQHIESI